jgi:phage tail-like protein
MADGDYPVGFYFSVSFEGEALGFQEVSGISKHFGIEEVQSGGESRFKYKLPTVVTSENLILKRALVPNDSGLVQWFDAVLNAGVSELISTKDIAVNLLDSQGEVLVQWNFYKAYPIKYSVSDLHSQKNALVIETMELAYTYFDTSS